MHNTNLFCNIKPSLYNAIQFWHRHFNLNYLSLDSFSTFSRFGLILVPLNSLPLYLDLDLLLTLYLDLHPHPQPCAKAEGVRLSLGLQDPAAQVEFEHKLGFGLVAHQTKYGQTKHSFREVEILATLKEL